MLGLAALAAGCSQPPDLSEGEQGRIVRAFDGDLVTLDAGLRVRLVEIEAPRASDPYGPEASAILRAASVGRQARLWYGGLTRDRYERALAHVIVSDETGRDIWLNGMMAHQGAARVRSWPDNARRVRELYRLEAEARAAKRGLWALPDYAVRSPAAIGDPAFFTIVEGALLGLKQAAGEGRCEIGATGVQLIAGDMMGPHDPMLDLAAKRVRIRGKLEYGEGGMIIRLTHWAQVETLKG